MFFNRHQVLPEFLKILPVLIFQLPYHSDHRNYKMISLELLTMAVVAIAYLFDC